MKSIATTIATFAMVLAYAATANAQCDQPNCTSCAQPAPAPVVVDCACGQPSCVAVQPEVVVSDCGCSKPGCLKGRQPIRSRIQGCRLCQGGCSQPTKCEGDTCKLELDNSKVKKSCYKTEQKSVCVPPVRFPWQKCCPPGKSKTRLVTVLKKHSYECENCAYKWSVQKAEPAEAAKPEAGGPQNTEPTPVYDSYVPQESITIAPADSFVPEQYVPQQTTPTQVIPEQIVPERVISPTVIPETVVPPAQVPQTPAIVPSVGQTSSRNTRPWRVGTN